MLDVNQKLCTGCAACYNICPKECISMQENEEGFLYPVINTDLCVNCNACRNVCPLDKKNTALNCTYSVTNKTSAPSQSSSAGIAYQISKAVILDGGKAFGAVFDEEYTLVHSGISTLDELTRLQGSKYVQSDIKKTFKEVKEALLENRSVVFIGTPCQIAGLNAFLGKKYDNLYLIDFICHGVPSPKVWKYYLGYIKKLKNLGDIKSINFRDKTHGWASYGLRITGTDNEYFALKNDDLYETAFSRNIILRKSCYFCNFKGDNRYSDLTLGDFWGGQKYSSVYDSGGTSIVAVHTPQGQALFDKISESFNFEKTDLSEYTKNHNRAMVCSVTLTSVRKKFFGEFIASPENIAEQLKAHIKMTAMSFKIAALKNKIRRGMKKISGILKHIK